jgi:hypothetical protein
MYNQDVLDLYPRVATGTTVTVTWARFGASRGVVSHGPGRLPLREMRPSDLPNRF